MLFRAGEQTACTVSPRKQPQTFQALNTITALSEAGAAEWLQGRQRAFTKLNEVVSDTVRDVENDTSDNHQRYESVPRGEDDAARRAPRGRGNQDLRTDERPLVNKLISYLSQDKSLCFIT